MAFRAKEQNDHQPLSNYETVINNKSVTKTNIFIYRFFHQIHKTCDSETTVEEQSGVSFPTPGSYPVFETMNCSLWTCSKSFMPYSIQFINNYKFLLQPLPGPALLLFFLLLITELCQENARVIANILFQQHKRRLYTWTSPDGQFIICFVAKEGEVLYSQQNKTGS